MTENLYQFLSCLIHLHNTQIYVRQYLILVGLTLLVRQDLNPPPTNILQLSNVTLFKKQLKNMLSTKFSIYFSQYHLNGPGHTLYSNTV